jgi:hypothetical protein
MNMQRVPSFVKTRIKLHFEKLSIVERLSFEMRDAAKVRVKTIPRNGVGA